MSKKNNTDEGKKVVTELLDNLKSGKAIVYSKTEEQKVENGKQMELDQKKLFFKAIIMLNATQDILQEIENLGANKHRVKFAMFKAMGEITKSIETTFHYDGKDVILFVEQANSQITNFLNEYTKEIT